jgi:hypothetical protein
MTSTSATPPTFSFVKELLWTPSSGSSSVSVGRVSVREKYIDSLSLYSFLELRLVGGPFEKMIPVCWRDKKFMEVVGRQVKMVGAALEEERKDSGMSGRGEEEEGGK